MLALTLSFALAAEPAPPTPQTSRPELSAWNARRLGVNRASMIVLGAWALGNLAVGSVGFATASDERVRFLHLGNAAWNVVNLALATIGLISDWGKDPASFDARQSLEAISTQQKVLLVNAGLDVAYLATAAFLWQRGDATADARLVGLGQALLIQGGFLLVFDVVCAVLAGRLTEDLLLGVELVPARTGGVDGAGLRVGLRW